MSLRFATDVLRAENGQPRLGGFPAGAVVGAAFEFGKRTCKPNSVVCGHSSRRRVAADTHQRPTRRFQRLPEPPERIGPMRSAAWLQAAASLPIWSCSMWGLPCPRPHGRSGALLPHHFTLTPAGVLAGGVNPSESSGCPGRSQIMRRIRRVVYDRSRGSRGGIFSVALAVHGP